MDIQGRAQPIYALLQGRGIVEGEAQTQTIVQPVATGEADTGDKANVMVLGLF